jgi:plasmid stabilization system protein ParE
MTQTLVVSTLAEDDLAEAAARYDQLRPGLAHDFVLCVEKALNRIVDYPHGFPVILPEVRRALVRRFPYGIFYRTRQCRIEIEAIFCLRLHPTHLRQRLNASPKADS